ncbi:hypothetical protein AB0J43_03825 [Nonomuraea fuscirosea]
MAAINLSAAPERMRPIVTFLTLFISVAAGTLSMQGIENSVGPANSTAQVLASINYFSAVRGHHRDRNRRHPRRGVAGRLAHLP